MEFIIKHLTHQPSYHLLVVGQVVQVLVQHLPLLLGMFPFLFPLECAFLLMALDYPYLVPYLPDPLVLLLLPVNCLIAPA